MSPGASPLEPDTEISPVRLPNVGREDTIARLQRWDERAKATPTEPEEEVPVSDFSAPELSFPALRSDETATPSGKQPFDALDAARNIADNWERMVPFYNFAPELADTGNIYQSYKRILDGTADEKDIELAKLWQGREQELAERGTTLGYKVLEIASQIPAFGAEFVATSGLYTAGKKATMAALQAALKNVSKDVIEKNLLARGAAFSVGALAQTPAVMGLKLPANVLQRMTPDMQLTEDEQNSLYGEITKEGDDFNTAIAKALGDSYIEVFSERTGGLVPAAWAKLPFAAKTQALKAALISRLFKSTPNPDVAALLGKLKDKAAWNGILGEMFEERVGEAMRAISGIDDEYQLAAIYKRGGGDAVAEQLAAEALAFAIPGAGRSVLERLPRKGGAVEPTEPPTPDQLRQQDHADLRSDLKQTLDDPRPMDEIAAERQRQEAEATAAAEAEQTQALANLSQQYGVPNVDDRVVVTWPDQEPVNGILTDLYDFTAPDGKTWGGKFQSDDGRLYDISGRNVQIRPLPDGDGTQQAPVKVEHPADVDVAAQQTEKPTPAQAGADNYKQGHVQIKPWLDVSIETPRGGTRTAKDGSWEVRNFPAHYGKIKGSTGADGDHVDIFIGRNAESRAVYVIDQIEPSTGKFDEHKVMYGFGTDAEARATYGAAFTDNSGAARIGAITSMSADQFQAWLKNGKTKMPLSYDEAGALASRRKAKQEAEAAQRQEQERIKAEKETQQKQAKGPQPNEHGVYDSNAAEAIKYDDKKANASIVVLQVGENEWIAAGSFGHKQGSYTGHAVPLSGQRHPSREAAIIAAARNIIRGNKGVLAATDSLTSEAQKAQAAAIIRWARKYAPDTTPETPQAEKAEPGKTEQPPDKLGEAIKALPEGWSIKRDENDRYKLISPTGGVAASAITLTVARINSWLSHEIKTWDRAAAERVAAARAATEKPQQPEAEKPKEPEKQSEPQKPAETTPPQAQLPAESEKSAEPEKLVETEKAGSRSKKQREQARRSLERSLYADALEMSEIIEEAKGDFETFAKNADQIIYTHLVKQQREAAKSSDTGRAKMIGEYMADGKTVLPPDFFKSLHKAAQKAAKHDELEKSRDPEIYKAALSKAMAEAGIADEGGDQFRQGWDHAIKGKTKSTLPYGEVLAKGYEAAQKWLKTGDGRAYYQGKRGKKLKNTGADLRRWFDGAKKKLDDANGVEAVLKEVEAATSRSDMFRNVPGVGATPGTVFYINEIRDDILPFKEWAVRHGPLSETYGVWSKRRATDERLRNYLTGKASLSGKESEVTGERIARVKELAQKYIDTVGEIASAMQGAKTMDDAAATFGKLIVEETTRTEGGYPQYKQTNFGASFQKEGFWRGYQPWQNYVSDSWRFKEFKKRENDSALLADNRKQPLTPPRLDRVVREGMKDHRKGKDITPKQFKETFGFKDVGFGKWVGAKQDQDHLNYAYDAFMDLADTIGIKPRDISLGGTLYFTIGALGHGKHAAHYSYNQPHPDGGTVAVINVTNTKGDGTVAHEWHHALDYHLRKSAQDHMVIERLISDLKANYDYEAVRASAIRFLKGGTWFTTMKNDGPLGNARYAVRYYANRGSSKYKTEANRLDGGNREKPYWGNDEELFARAGEAFVLDKIEGIDNYLVNPEWVGDGKVKPPKYRGTPYPEGDERRRFNEWYEALYKVLDWTDAGPVLNQERFKELAPKHLEEYNKAIEDLRSELPEMLAQIKNEGKAKALAADEEAARKKREADEKARLEAEAKKLVEQTSPPAPVGELGDDEISAQYDRAAILAKLREKVGGKEAPSIESETDRTAAKLAADAAKLGVQGIDEAMKGLVELFGGARIKSFPSGFDEEAYQKAKPHFEAALKAFQDAGKTLVDLFKFLIEKFGMGIRPYAERFAKDMNLSAKLGQAPSASREIAQWVRDQLSAGNDIRWQDLFEQADKAYGGTQADGKYTPKDAYDAMEAGVNLYVMGGNYKPSSDAVLAERDIRNLRRLLDQIPTQTKRTAEQDEYQQFSTPPMHAYVAAWVANIHRGESMLEPSAGIGGLAIFADLAGARVTVNELSQRRAAVLRDVLPNARMFNENAEQLNNVLPDDVKPTVIVMNPPFSATAGRMQGARKTEVGAQHIEQALKRLADKGRLVAIVGEGMAMDKPAFKAWWDKIRTEYNVRANVGMPGKDYAKYGTTFDNQLLVIDKTGPTTGKIITDTIASIEELPKLLEGVRNDRPETDQAGEPDAAQPGREEVPAGGVAAGGVARIEPDAVGTGEQAGDRTAEPVATDTGDGRGPSEPARPGQPEGGDAVPDRTGGRARAGGRRAAGAGKSTGSSEAAAGDATRKHGGDSGVKLGQTDKQKAEGEITEAVFEEYKPQRLKVEGAQPHLGKLVQSAVMAAVEPPAPTYVPNLPKEVITQGKLSLAQIEAVVYAGQAHQNFLPDGSRRGFFIGDGTGVGKGREIAGIILDNIRQGRKRHVWISEKRGLFKDAGRDFADVGGNKAALFKQHKTAATGNISVKSGILFSTYSMLRSGEKKQATDKTKKQGKTRVQQIVDWLGPDFDGVLVFDESHNMANAVQKKGARGKMDASKQALAGIELQKQLSKARVIYVSATGATEVSNLVYAQRLGLWGEGTAFSGPNDFVTSISAGGVAGMELVARDLKALGSYIARSLSFDGVTYERLEHSLTPLQTDIYNEMAKAWQIVLQNVNNALKETLQGKNGAAKSAAMSRFWSSHQRFFNQVVTSLQMPSIIEDVRKHIEAGHAVVMQLVNTNEAEQERQVARAEEEGKELEELDFTPRQALLDYVRTGYPVQQYEEYADDEGNKRTRPAMDSQGKPVINKEMEAERDRLLKTLDEIKVPDNPIDIILESFGPDTVAEVTGRSRRFIRKRGDGGDFSMIEEKRTGAAAEADAAAFMDDKKRVLLFSDAGGTGYSFHADKTRLNQRRRYHYLVQPGWRADKAVQGFGRTHRTNQDSEPHYVLPTTNLKAQKRFISSIARRLDQLGALTKGQRQAGSQGLFSAADNLESKYATEAMQVFFEDLYSDRTPLNFGETTKAMGLDNLVDSKTGALNDTNIPTVPRFLNRLLSLTTDMQDKVFDEFFNRMEEIVHNAIQKGTYDQGVETLKALKVHKLRDDVAYTDPRSGAETHFVELELTLSTEFHEWTDVQQRADLAKGDFAGYFRNNKTGKVFALINRGTRTSADGKLLHRAVQIHVSGSARYIDNANDITDPRRRENQQLKVGEKVVNHYEELTQAEAQAAWEKERAESPQTHTSVVHMISGAILPIWDRVTGQPRVIRTQTDDGERLLGRVVHKDELKQTLKNLGLGSSASKLSAQQLFDRIMAGDKALLANGWEIRKVRVSNDERIEVSALSMSPADHKLLQEQGAFIERIQWRDRVFIPTGDMAVDVLGRIIKAKPVVDLIETGGGVVRENEPRYSEPVPIFYSALKRAIESVKQPKAPAAQWKAIIKSLPGIKADEIEAVGLNEWLALQQGSITKDAILDFVRANGVQIKEVEHLSTSTATPRAPTDSSLALQSIEDYKNKLRSFGEFDVDMGEDFATGVYSVFRLNTEITKDGLDYVDMGYADAPDDNEHFTKHKKALVKLMGQQGYDDLEAANGIMMNLQERYESDGRREPLGGLIFERYTLPGGENYRELLLTLPETGESGYVVVDATGPGRKVFATREEAEELAKKGREASGNTDIHVEPTSKKPGSFRSSHFPEPNIIAHVRFNERTDADGKRVLFIEELQSDWAQKGRKEGFQEKDAPDFVAVTDSGQRVGFDTEREAEDWLDEHGEDGEVIPGTRKAGVPPAPFVTKTESWAMLAMKRMLRYAAENGFDRIAWTTGEQQADRYDLSKQIRELWYKRNPDGTYRLTAYKTSADGIQLGTNIAADKLEDHIGKDVAKRIVDGAGENADVSANNEPANMWKKLSGLDLKVGGEGMRAFYDQMLPQMVNKYVKKWGGKVGETKLPGIYEARVSSKGTWYVVDVAAKSADMAESGVAGPFKTEAEAQAALDELGGASAHSIDITPAMRDAVMQGQVLFEPKPDYTDGHGVKDQHAKRLGQDALRDLEGLVDRRPPTGRGRLLGSIIPAEFAEKGSISLVGQKVESAEDLAVLAQVYRDPRFETFRYILTRGNEIVGHTGVTSRLPGSTPAFVGKNTDEMMRFVQELRDQMEEVGADGYYLLHNHPSGEPNASGADIAATRNIYRNLNGFKGHVIIDTDSYGLIEISRSGEISKGVVVKRMPPTYRLGENPSVPHPLLGRIVGSPRELAAAVKQIETSPDQIVLIGANRNGVRGIMEVPVSVFERRMRITAIVRKFARQTGSAHVFAAHVPKKYAEEVKKGVKYGVVRDVIFDDGSSAYHTLGEAPDRDFALGRNIAEEGRIAEEEKPTYSQDPRRLIETSRNIKNFVMGLLAKSDNLTRWQRSVGTKYHTALELERKGHPEYRKLFDEVQDYLGDATAIAIRAEAQAPNIFKRVTSLGSFVNPTASQSDIHAIAAPLYEGTLAGRGPMSGKVWSDTDLKKVFGLTPKQIQLYREARAAVNQSLDDFSKAMIARAAQAAEVGYDQSLPLQDMSTEVLDALEFRRKLLRDAIDDMGDAEAQKARAQLKTIAEKARVIMGVVDRVTALKEHGYFPLMRFGKYTVSMRDDANRMQFYGMYETKTEQHSTAAALRELHPDMTVTLGIASRLEHELYQGINLESLQLFAEYLEAEGSEPYQEYLQKVINNRSALKRMVHRKGTPGFSTNVERTLARFLVSNARHASNLYHLSRMKKFADSVPSDMGDVKDDAIALVSYVQEGKEEAAWLRGFLFTYYIGGSIASAVVNLTQPQMMSAPYLAEHTDFSTVEKELHKAAVLAFKNPKNVGGRVGTELRKAEETGITAPQEIYQLTAMASNQLFASHPHANSALKAWGIFFSSAEVLNRRTTFIAAYNIATEKLRKSPGDAYKFAVDAVEATQGIYNKGNRPNWARGKVGATVFTFKQFNIMYLELFKRLWTRNPKAALIMLGILLLAAGLEGMPFYEDVTDLLDTILQWLGYNVVLRAEIRRATTTAAKAVLGEKAGEVSAKLLLRGISAVIPIDIHSRLGFHNVIPGTSILKQSETDKAGEIAEAVGPLGGLIEAMGNALEDFARGRVLQGIFDVTPRAGQNWWKGIEGLVTGKFTDQKGRVMYDDVTRGEAIIKFIGFNPVRMAEEGKARRELRQESNLVKVRKDEIIDDLVAGNREYSRALDSLEAWNSAHPNQRIKEPSDETIERVLKGGKYVSVGAGEQARVEREIMDRLVSGLKQIENGLGKQEAWNQRNPETPMQITPQQVRQRVRAGEATSKDRFLKATPKAMRERAAERLGIDE